LSFFIVIVLLLCIFATYLHDTSGSGSEYIKCISQKQQ